MPKSSYMIVCSRCKIAEESDHDVPVNYNCEQCNDLNVVTVAGTQTLTNKTFSMKFPHYGRDESSYFGCDGFARDSQGKIVKDQHGCPIYEDVYTKMLPKNTMQLGTRPTTPRPNFRGISLSEEAKETSHKSVEICKWHGLTLNNGKCKKVKVDDPRHPVKTIQRLSEAYRKQFGKKLTDEVVEAVKPLIYYTR